MQTYKLSEKEKYDNDKKLAKDLVNTLIPIFSKNWINDLDNDLTNSFLVLGTVINHLSINTFTISALVTFVFNSSLVLL